MSHPDGLYIVSEPENGKDVTFEWVRSPINVTDELIAT